MPMAASAIDAFQPRENLQHKLLSSSAWLAVRMTEVGGFALGILPLIPPGSPPRDTQAGRHHVGVSRVIARHCWGIARHH
jgi:hypothetical protein